MIHILQTCEITKNCQRAISKQLTQAAYHFNESLFMLMYDPSEHNFVIYIHHLWLLSRYYNSIANVKNNLMQLSKQTYNNIHTINMTLKTNKPSRNTWNLGLVN